MSILLWTPAILKLYPVVMSLGLMPLNVAFPIIVFVNLGMLSPATWLPVSGYAHGLTGLVFLYLGGAFVVNAVFGREVMYLGKPLIR
jgi:nitrate reductase gamma subunit